MVDCVQMSPVFISPLFKRLHYNECMIDNFENIVLAVPRIFSSQRAVKCLKLVSLVTI